MRLPEYFSHLTKNNCKVADRVHDYLCLDYRAHKPRSTTNGFPNLLAFTITFTGNDIPGGWQLLDPTHYARNMLPKFQQLFPRPSTTQISYTIRASLLPKLYSLPYRSGVRGDSDPGTCRGERVLPCQNIARDLMPFFWGPKRERTVRCHN